MASDLPTAVYLLCFLASSTCASLLGRAWWRSRARILLWSALCFTFLAYNNFIGIWRKNRCAGHR
jgi:biotin transporter BioY